MKTIKKKQGSPKKKSEVLLEFTQLETGKFIHRDNRFVVTADIKKRHIKCHLHDPGRLKELMTPGADLLLLPATGQRKTRYDVIAVKKKYWIFIHSGYHNTLVKKLLEQKKIPELTEYTIFQSEYTYGKSRIDFLLKNSQNCLLEIKGCTLIQNNVAVFPDAPTTRGQRHVHELIHAIQEGYQATILFVIMGNAHMFTPNWQMDPDFSAALQTAEQKKVQLLAYTFHFENGGLYLGKKIPVITQDLTRKIKNLTNGPIGDVVKDRMKSFQQLGTKENTEWFSELCFCVLTANESGEKGIRIQKALTNEFHQAPEEILQEKLKEKGYRFHNRAKYITYNRRYRNIKDIISSFTDIKDARDWLVAHVKGIGYKEASHFLRNVGYTNFAILDRHILRCMRTHGLIPSIPQALNRSRYQEIEQILVKCARKAGLSVGALDLYLWYLETQKVLK